MLETFGALLDIAVRSLALVIETCAVTVVAAALVRWVWQYVRDLIARTTPFPRTGMRLDFGRSLALSLELLLGADIVQTAIDPSWNDLGRLAAIAAIRTALNFFLQREIAHEERQTRIGSHQDERAEPRRAA